MVLLLKNGDVYAPEYLGKQDVLIVGNTIEVIAPAIDLSHEYVKILDCSGKILAPGFIDGHVHLIGGGECPSCLRIPESQCSDFISCGVTTVLGLLGTDGITKSLESLYTKCKCLENEGMSAYMLTGAYCIPSPTLTGSVMRDVLLIDKVIGVKSAISDHRSSAPQVADLAKLCAEARVGGLLSNKAGLCVMHLGSGKDTLKPILEMLESTDIPRKNILPTHVGRSPQLFHAAIQYAKSGGHIDLTASEKESDISTAHQLHIALEEGVSDEMLTISSDAYGSRPIFDEEGRLINISYTNSQVLYENFMSMILEEKIPMEVALKFVSSNVAARMGLETQKGHLKAGYDADIIVMNPDLSITDVLCKGREMMRNQELCSQYL